MVYLVNVSMSASPTVTAIEAEGIWCIIYYSTTYIGQKLPYQPSLLIKAATVAHFTQES